MTAQGVRRDKAALSSGCKPHPATAPAGSNRSRHGGDVLVVKDHQGKLAPAAHPERGRPLRAMNSGNASSALAPLTTCVVQCRSLLHCCSRFPGPDRLMAPAMQQSQAALREKRENQVRKRLAATRRLSDLRLGVEPAFGRRPDSRKSRFAQDSLLEGTGFEPSVPGCERVNPFPGVGLTEATRGGLETVARLCREPSPLRRGLQLWRPAVAGGVCYQFSP